MRYYALHSTLTSAQDCQYYFRRYPFSGLPVDKHEHLRYVCEMYFGRFYEFSERLKDLIEAIKEHSADVPHFNYGSIIKIYAKEFDRELRQRNEVHHHNRFEDIAIDNIALLSLSSINDTHGHWKRRNAAAYRNASREWAERVVLRTARMREFVYMAADLILLQCKFLSGLAPDRVGEPVSALPPLNHP